MSHKMKKTQHEEESEDSETEEEKEEEEEEGEEEEEDEECDEEEEEPPVPVKKKKAGIVYLSSIPPKMNVQLLRETLMPYGEIGRVFLQQPATKRNYNLFP